MSIVETDIEQIWQSIESLPPESREVIWARLANAEAKNGDSTSPKTLLKDERFVISFEDYLALSDDELDEIQIAAYKDYHAWIDHELAKRQAKWILVCGGKIVESSKVLDDHPSDDKMYAVGKQLGYAPFVFMAGPVIEESEWAVLDNNDFYPSLSLTLGGTDWERDEVLMNGILIDGDFDTGSGNTLLDYNRLRSKGIIKSQRSKRTHERFHLGQSYRFYFLPVQIAVTTEAGEIFSKNVSAMCVRNWQQSPLCLANSVRKALVGRDLLLEFPLRVELDGGKRKTKILAASS
jgi:hypothetical protein